MPGATRTADDHRLVPEHRGGRVAADDDEHAERPGRPAGRGRRRPSSAATRSACRRGHRRPVGERRREDRRTPATDRSASIWAGPSGAGCRTRPGRRRRASPAGHGGRSTAAPSAVVAATAAAMLPAVPAKQRPVRIAPPHARRSRRGRRRSTRRTPRTARRPRRPAAQRAPASASSTTSPRTGADEVLGRPGGRRGPPSVATADRDTVDVDDAAAAGPTQPGQRRDEQHPAARRPLHGHQLVGPVAAQQRVDLVGAVAGRDRRRRRRRGQRPPLPRRGASRGRPRRPRRRARSASRRSP